MKKILFLLLIAASFFAKGQTTVPTVLTRPNDFTFTLSKYYPATSAGVYDASGVLKRTLWSNVHYAAGTHKEHWDGYDDDGNLCAFGNYTIKVLADSVTYTWEGVAINTSDSTNGAKVWHAYNPICDLAQSGSYMYVATAYNEADASTFKFNIATPQQKIRIGQLGTGFAQGTYFVCTDGTNVYWAGNSANAINNFVFATKVSDDSFYNFPSGGTQSGNGSHTYSAIDINANGAPGIQGGIAVQKTGVYLFVSHPLQDVIRVYNKTSGLFVRTLTVPGAGRLFLENDNTLWVGEGGTVYKYTVAGDGSISASVLSITGNQRVAGLSVLGGKVSILGGGTNQYINIYNSTSGAFIGSLLQPGGYTTTSVVANDRIYIEDLHGVTSGPNGVRLASIAPQSDSSIWVTDPGNQRLQHFSKTGTYINSISYLGATYSANVCLNANTSIFANMKEYLADYNQPAKTSLTLTHNYGYLVPTTWNGGTVTGNQYNPSQVAVLSNTRKYCIFKNSLGQSFFAELTSIGFIPFSSVLPNGAWLNPDGSITSCALSGLTQIYTRYTITGFRPSGEPVLSAGTTAASYNIAVLYPRATVSSFFTTTTNKMIAFSASYASTARPAEYHLMAYDLTAHALSWKSAKPTFRAYTGQMPGDNRFDIGNATNFQGGSQYVIGNNIIFNYHGEGWKNGQTNYLYHYYENGLLVGTTGVSLADTSEEAPPGLSGNTLTTNLTQVGSDYYIWQQDESRHSGLHRWHIANLSSINVQSIGFTLTNRLFTPTVSRTDLLAGVAESSPLVNNANNWTRFPVTDIPAGLSTYVSTTRVSTYDKSKSPDLYIKVNGKSASGFVNYNAVRTLHGPTTDNNWTITGKLYMYRAFNSTAGATNAGTGHKFHVDVVDINNKVIGTFLAVGGGNGTLNFNDVAVGTGTMFNGNRPVEFSITRKGSNIWLVLKSYKTKVSGSFSIYDGTANIAKPGYFGLYWRLDTSTQSQASEMGVSDLYFSGQ